MRNLWPVLPVLCLIAAPALLAQDPFAFELFEKGRAAEKAGRMSEAYLAYAQAAAADPENRTYWQRSQAVRFRAVLEQLKVTPMVATLPEIEEFPEPSIDRLTVLDRAAMQQMLPPVELKPQPAVRDFSLRGDSRKLFEEVTKAFGLDCVFDKEYEPANAVRFELTHVNYRDALYALEDATNSFAFPISTKTIFVAKDTPQKRAELEPTATITVPIPTAMAAADFQALMVDVRQALALERVGFDSQTNMLMIRDRISKILPAKALIRDLMRLPGQTSVEMKLMEVSLNDMIQYGVSFPNTFSLTALTTYLQNQVKIPTSISGLLTFGGGKTLIGIGFIAPQLVAQMSNSRGKVLYDTVLPSVEGKAAEMHLGEQYPVATSGYFGPASFSGAGAYVPPPTFSYVDLGLQLKVTSRMHGSDEVTMDVDAEFKLLTGQSVNGSPIISNRVVKSTVRLNMGDWAVFSGLLNPSESVSLSGLPGLTRVPCLKYLTTQTTKNKTDDQFLILLRPRLDGLTADQFPTKTYALGSDTRPRIPL